MSHWPDVTQLESGGGGSQTLIFNKAIALIKFKLMFFKYIEWCLAHSKHDTSSVQFSRSVVSDSSRPHESQHARPPHPSPTPGVYPNSCPLSW